MYLLIIFFPLFGAFCSGFLGRFIGRFGSIFLTTFCIFLSFIVSLFIFYEVCLNGSICQLKFLCWFDVGLLNVYWGFLFDQVTSFMLIIVTLISFLVHLYSINYMENDPYIIRFMSYLSLFTLFMLFLVTSDNFIQMFLGWEGVGLASYLLINFWFTRNQANKSAMKALIVNRVGDLGLVIGLSIIYSVFKSLNYYVVFPLSPLFYLDSFNFFFFEFNSLNIISFFLFVGAVGKSAQIGLHTWLPDAMEGPTPVSALIHAATMVTAGVFLIIRCSPIIEYSPFILLLISFVGALTAFFAATAGIFQNDIKKVIAYSTCSQLGYMIFACGLSNYNVGFFHLINHAYFKALLFLSAGSAIHALSDEQDMRKMGGLVNLLPVTYLMMFFGSLSLMGLPFLTGFYSKDVILELSYSYYSINSFFIYWLGIVSAFFTSYYSFRLLYLTFWCKPNGYKIIFQKVHESSFLIKIPLLVLFFGTIFFGYFTKDMFIGLGTDFWGYSIFNLPDNIIILNSEFVPYHIKLLPVFFSFFGAFFVYYNNVLFLNHNYYGLNLNLKKIYSFLINKWYFDYIYNYFIVLNFLSVGFFSFKEIDRGFIEIFGPLGFVRLVSNKLRLLNNIQTSYIHHYIFIMILGAVFFILLFWIFLSDFFILIDSRFYLLFMVSVFFLFDVKESK